MQKTLDYAATVKQTIRSVINTQTPEEFSKHLDDLYVLTKYKEPIKNDEEYTKLYKQMKLHHATFLVAQFKESILSVEQYKAKLSYIYDLLRQAGIIKYDDESLYDDMCYFPGMEKAGLDQQTAVKLVNDAIIKQFIGFAKSVVKLYPSYILSDGSISQLKNDFIPEGLPKLYDAEFSYNMTPFEEYEIDIINSVIAA